MVHEDIDMVIETPLPPAPSVGPGCFTLVASVVIHASLVVAAMRRIHPCKSETRPVCIRGSKNLAWLALHEAVYCMSGCATTHLLKSESGERPATADRHAADRAGESDVVYRIGAKGREGNDRRR